MRFLRILKAAWNRWSKYGYALYTEDIQPYHARKGKAGGVNKWNL